MNEMTVNPVRDEIRTVFNPLNFTREETALLREIVFVTENSRVPTPDDRLVLPMMITSAPPQLLAETLKSLVSFLNADGQKIAKGIEAKLEAAVPGVFAAEISDDELTKIVDENSDALKRKIPEMSFEAQFVVAAAMSVAGL